MTEEVQVNEREIKYNTQKTLLGITREQETSDPDFIPMKVTVVGAGYVGLSVATLLALRKYNVTLLEVIPEKCEMINDRKCPIEDAGIKNAFLEHPDMLLYATTDKAKAYLDTGAVIVCVPTNFNEDTNAFDTSIVESVIQDALNYSIEESLNAIIIKSTVPVGFTKQQRKETGCNKLMFMPEFLREGHALEDLEHPSRVILGFDMCVKDFDDNEQALMFVGSGEAEAMFCEYDACEGSKYIITPDIMSSDEAEAVKLFSNTYLASRVAFFNEVDTFAQIRGLSTYKIINGICEDDRIGRGYNNPSFGYGGYCLPKDTKQLVSSFKDINAPETLMTAVVRSNECRKKFIVEEILKFAEEIGLTDGLLFPTIGIYQLAMKAGSDNCKESAILDIMRELEKTGKFIFVVYDNNVELAVDNYPVCKDIKQFVETSDIIIANRLVGDIMTAFPNYIDSPYMLKTYTCDIFGNN